MIETDTYKWKASHTVRRLATDWIGRWWYAFAIPLGIFCMIGLWDWRWYVVALALILVAYPGILAIVYYSIALSPETVRSILPQKARFETDKLIITYQPYAEDCSCPAPMEIAYNQINEIIDNGASLIIKLPNFAIEIPFSAFSSPDDAKKAISLLPNLQA